tara:strand:+ start:5054 stop:5218 length:165 start_codon:yes stop_codon:yes gene_type:complete
MRKKKIKNLLEWSAKIIGLASLLLCPCEKRFKMIRLLSAHLAKKSAQEGRSYDE